MKAIQCFGSTLALFFMLSLASKAGLPEAPIEIRLSRLGGILKQFRMAELKSAIVAGRLMKSGTAYMLKWVQPISEGGARKEEQSMRDIVEIAVTSLKDKLPKGLQPEAANLLGIGRYQIAGSVTPSWIWVAEFQVEDESPVGGTGYMPTLFVPVSIDGKILLDVQEVPR